MGGASDLVHAQRAEGERLAGVGVDEQHLGVQNHTVAAGERPRDVVLEVCHLETGTKTIKEKERKKKNPVRLGGNILCPAAPSGGRAVMCSREFTDICRE